MKSMKFSMTNQLNQVKICFPMSPITTKNIRLQIYYSFVLFLLYQQPNSNIVIKASTTKQVGAMCNIHKWNIRNTFLKRNGTSMNQSYSEKKRGRPKRSETAPSATGIDPILPPLKKLVRRLLALSNRFLDFCLSVLVDWHLYEKQITN